MLATMRISDRLQRVKQSIKALHHSWKISRSMLNILAHELQKKPLKYIEHALIINNRVNLVIMIVAEHQLFMESMICNMSSLGLVAGSLFVSNANDEPFWSIVK